MSVLNSYRNLFSSTKKVLTRKRLEAMTFGIEVVAHNCACLNPSLAKNFYSQEKQISIRKKDFVL